MKHDPPAFTGTRDELVAELHRAVEGWTHYGKPTLAEQAREGVSLLQAGETSVQVGHVAYRVTD